jgi:hypothetical protein
MHLELFLGFTVDVGETIAKIEDSFRPTLRRSVFPLAHNAKTGSVSSHKAVALCLNSIDYNQRLS